MITKKCYNVVNYSDLDRFLTSLLGFEYECVALEEWSNGSCYEFHVTGGLNEWDRQNIEEMMKTKKPKQWTTYGLLDYAAEKGVIEPGDYLVKVSW